MSNQSDKNLIDLWGKTWGNSGDFPVTSPDATATYTTTTGSGDITWTSPTSTSIGITPSNNFGSA
jgi:hypothetical protein